MSRPDEEPPKKEAEDGEKDNGEETKVDEDGGKDNNAEGSDEEQEQPGKRRDK